MDFGHCNYLMLRLRLIYYALTLLKLWYFFVRWSETSLEDYGLLVNCTFSTLSYNCQVVMPASRTGKIPSNQIGDYSDEICCCFHGSQRFIVLCHNNTVSHHCQSVSNSNEGPREASQPITPWLQPQESISVSELTRGQLIISHSIPWKVTVFYNCMRQNHC